MAETGTNTNQTQIATEAQKLAQRQQDIARMQQEFQQKQQEFQQVESKYLPKVGLTSRNVAYEKQYQQQLAKTQQSQIAQEEAVKAYNVAVAEYQARYEDAKNVLGQISTTPTAKDLQKIEEAYSKGYISPDEYASYKDTVKTNENIAQLKVEAEKAKTEIAKLPLTPTSQADINFAKSLADKGYISQEDYINYQTTGTKNIQIGKAQQEAQKIQTELQKFEASRPQADTILTKIGSTTGATTTVYELTTRGGRGLVSDQGWVGIGITDKYGDHPTLTRAQVYEKIMDASDFKGMSVEAYNDYKAAGGTRVYPTYDTKGISAPSWRSAMEKEQAILKANFAGEFTPSMASLAQASIGTKVAPIMEQRAQELVSMQTAQEQAKLKSQWTANFTPASLQLALEKAGTDVSKLIQQTKADYAPKPIETNYTLPSLGRDISKELGLDILKTAAPTGTTTLDQALKGKIPIIAQVPTSTIDRRTEAEKTYVYPLFEATREKISEPSAKYIEENLGKYGNLGKVATGFGEFFTTLPEFFVTGALGAEIATREVIGGKGKEIPAQFLTSATLVGTGMVASAFENPYETLGQVAGMVVLGKISPKAPPAEAKINIKGIKIPKVEEASGIKSLRETIPSIKIAESSRIADFTAGLERIGELKAGATRQVARARVETQKLAKIIQEPSLQSQKVTAGRTQVVEPLVETLKTPSLQSQKVTAGRVQLVEPLEKVFQEPSLQAQKVGIAKDVVTDFDKTIRGGIEKEIKKPTRGKEAVEALKEETEKVKKSVITETLKTQQAFGELIQRAPVKPEIKTLEKGTKLPEQKFGTKYPEISGMIRQDVVSELDAKLQRSGGIEREVSPKDIVQKQAEILGIPEEWYGKYSQVGYGGEYSRIGIGAERTKISLPKEIVEKPPTELIPESWYGRFSQIEVSPEFERIGIGGERTPITLGEKLIKKEISRVRVGKETITKPRAEPEKPTVREVKPEELVQKEPTPIIPEDWYGKNVQIGYGGEFSKIGIGGERTRIMLGEDVKPSIVDLSIPIKTRPEVFPYGRSSKISLPKEPKPVVESKLIEKLQAEKRAREEATLKFLLEKGTKLSNVVREVKPEEIITKEPTLTLPEDWYGKSVEVGYGGEFSRVGIGGAREKITLGEEIKPSSLAGLSKEKEIMPSQFGGIITDLKGLTEIVERRYKESGGELKVREPIQPIRLGAERTDVEGLSKLLSERGVSKGTGVVREISPEEFVARKPIEETIKVIEKPPTITKTIAQTLDERLSGSGGRLSDVVREVKPEDLIKIEEPEIPKARISTEAEITRDTTAKELAKFLEERAKKAGGVIPSRVVKIEDILGERSKPASKTVVKVDIKAKFEKLKAERESGVEVQVGQGMVQVLKMEKPEQIVKPKAPKLVQPKPEVKTVDLSKELVLPKEAKIEPSQREKMIAQYAGLFGATSVIAEIPPESQFLQPSERLAQFNLPPVVRQRRPQEQVPKPVQKPTQRPSVSLVPAFTQIPEEVPVQVPTQKPVQVPIQVPKQIPKQIEKTVQIPRQIPVQIPVPITRQRQKQVPVQEVEQMEALKFKYDTPEELFFLRRKKHEEEGRKKEQKVAEIVRYKPRESPIFGGAEVLFEDRRPPARGHGRKPQVRQVPAPQKTQMEKQVEANFVLPQVRVEEKPRSKRGNRAKKPRNGGFLENLII
jgi:hypothetical protein